MKKRLDQQNDKLGGVCVGGGYEAVMINPQRQIPCSYREKRGEERERKRGKGEKKLYLQDAHFNCIFKRAPH